MAKIEVVDYEAIPGQAGQMRSQGQELNNQISMAYQSIADMHSVWYGKRYNSLVESFNAIVSQVNELLKLVVGDIPYALESVARNYQAADTGTASITPREEPIKAITELAITNDVGMKFVTSDVQNVQKNVTDNFKNAIDKMNEIESTFNGVTWQSEAASAFKQKLSQLKGQIIESFESIKAEFDQLMNQAQQDIQNTENANTVS